MDDIKRLNMVLSTHWEDYYTEDVLYTLTCDLRENGLLGDPSEPVTMADMLEVFTQETQARIEEFFIMLERTSEAYGRIHAEVDMEKPNGFYEGEFVYQSLYEAFVELINVNEYQNIRVYYEDTDLTLECEHFDQDDKPMYDYYTMRDAITEARIYLDTTMEVLKHE
jgi:hypothetical protein